MSSSLGNSSVRARVSQSDSLPHGDERILVVEDDPQVRSVVQSMLGRLGYRVAAAAGAEHALTLLAEDVSGPDLLLTDLMMPGEGGRELSERLAARYPGMRVMYMSGDAYDDVVAGGVPPSEQTFVQKPFTRATLARKIRAVLDRGDPRR